MAPRFRNLPVVSIRILLILLPSLYFALIFWPAIGGGKVYGNRTNQEKLATELNDYYRNLAPKAALFAREPEMIHPDYELLYQPSNREVQRAFQSGRLPLYNPHRLLGTVLWGSPVTDAANPLSLLLLFFSPEHVHLIKIYLYTLFAFLGVYLCTTIVFNADPIPALIGASVYVLNPFMYYMYHWAALYGVVSLVPLLFCLVHLCLVRPRFLFLALVQVVLAWIIVINQLQVLLYFFLFLTVWIAAGLAFKVYSLEAMLRRAPPLMLSLVGGVVLTFGHTWYVIESGGALARQAHTYDSFSASWPVLLNIAPLLGMWWNGAPLKTWHYDATLVFFPILVAAVIVVALAGGRRLTTRANAALAVILCGLVVHCFIHALHYPLYLIHLPLYNLNWEHWRVIYLFYFTLSLAAAVSITVLAHKGMKRGMVLTIVFMAASVLYAMGSVHGAALPLTEMAGFAVLSHAWWRGFSHAHTVALGACIVAACLYLPITRVPFYEASSAPTPGTQIDETRSVRLIEFEQIRLPKAEYLWYNDSVMAMSSRSGATGYDTALQQREARLFSCFYSRDLRNLRTSNPLLKYGVQSSAVWPEAEGILTGGDTLPRVNEARLRLLGVGHVLWKRRIANLPEPHWDSVLNAWDHALASASAVSFLPDTTASDVDRLFSPSSDAALAERILNRQRTSPIHFDEKRGTYNAILPAGTGLVVITYNLGRFYRPFVDGAATTLESSELPFLLISKQTPASASLELRPQTTGIWIRIFVGLSVGLLIMAAVRAFYRIQPQAPAPGT
jgi:hypothetical protein